MGQTLLAEHIPNCCGEVCPRCFDRFSFPSGWTLIRFERRPGKNPLGHTERKCRKCSYTEKEIVEWHYNPFADCENTKCGNCTFGYCDLI
jgi:hypothetical protein